MKLRVAHAPGMPGTFSPPQRVSGPDKHHGTCVTHGCWHTEAHWRLYTSVNYSIISCSDNVYRRFDAKLSFETALVNRWIIRSLKTERVSLTQPWRIWINKSSEPIAKFHISKYITKYGKAVCIYRWVSARKTKLLCLSNGVTSFWHQPIDIMRYTVYEPKSAGLENHNDGMQFTILSWRHYERDGVSNYQPHDCLLNRLFNAQIKQNTKAPRHWPLCGEFTGDRWIPRTKGQ